MSINERIKAVRQALKVNQKDFADRLRMTQSNISIMEKHGSTVTEQNIKAICTTFGVSEKWLRTGVGDMFLSSRETLINRLKNELHLNDTEIAILNIYTELPLEDRNAILGFATKAVNIFASATAAPTLEGKAIADKVAAYDAGREHNMPIEDDVVLTAEDEAAIADEVARYKDELIHKRKLEHGWSGASENLAG